MSIVIPRSPAAGAPSTRTHGAPVAPAASGAAAAGAEAEHALARFSHSGETLEVRSERGQAMVHKTFRSHLDRAARNVDKQRRFPVISANGVTVRAAPVHAFVLGADSAVLTMPYVEGHVGEDIALYGGFALARQLRAALSEVVYREMADSDLARQPTQRFIAKLDEVMLRTRPAGLRAELAHVHQRLLTLPAWLDYPIGTCHGDLTLSNVILAPGQNVVLIDFLDTYFETPLQDVAKLMQDFEYGWSFRASAPELQVRGEVFLRESYPVAVRQFAAMYPMQTGLLSVMCLARIAPYVHDDATEAWLTNCLRRALRPGAHAGFAGPGGSTVAGAAAP